MNSYSQVVDNISTSSSDNKINPTTATKTKNYSEITKNELAEELVQIQTEMTFSRTAFNIGIEKWQNTSINITKFLTNRLQ